ncbi:MAG: Archaeal PaREP1/PaREP8 family protein [Candidatus Scalindua rubra]|uniref:Archaeal PaREP1/PaREP8 family protein n=1 Tax=Candidatus Scalindua rubra TaxID=1872076 RepID=A0A1E3XFQ3_9BACT|nr:MAG: Archaeal PaREP1/PaREP8 family protein [Candidatus Scalindua rubra]
MAGLTFSLICIMSRPDTERLLLDKQDYVQASEKLWGATAQIIKAVALKRGKKLRSHEAIIKYADKLSEELNDKSILVHFSVANSLHQNFYENWLSPKMVIQDAKIVEKLIKKLRPLAD